MALAPSWSEVNLPSPRLPMIIFIITIIVPTITFTIITIIIITIRVC